jgi:hypothetical protein
MSDREHELDPDLQQLAGDEESRLDSSAEPDQIEENKRVDKNDHIGKIDHVDKTDPTDEVDRAEQAAPERGLTSPAGAAGLLVGLLMTAALAGGYAVFALLGGRPAQLLAASSLLLRDALPAAGGLALLIFFGCLAYARSLSRARRRLRQLDESRQLVERVSQLDPRDSQLWLDEELDSYADLAGFLRELRDEMDHRKSKIDRYLGLEGELFRLEKSLSGRLRQELAGRFEYPAAGRLADEVSHLFDEAEKARQEATELRAKVERSGPEVCGRVQEAARWNDGALDAVNVHLATTGKLMQQLAQVAQTLQRIGEQTQADGDGAAVLTAVRRNVGILLATGGGEAANELVLAVKELVQRGGQLAIQLAADAARVGDGGLPLLENSRQLQALVTEFRAIAARLEGMAANQDKASVALGELQQRLERMPSLSPEVGQHTAAAAQRTQALMDSWQESMTLLGALPDGFGAQIDILRRLGQDLSELTGATFRVDPPAAGSGSSSQSEGLQVERFDPFSSKPRLRPRRSGLIEQPSIFSGEPTGDSPLSAQRDRIYDLQEFDAVAQEEEAPADAGDQDRIYDLEEFGAVALS